MLKSSGYAILRYVFAVVFVVMGETVSLAAGPIIPVPAVVIYPGDVITDSMLIDREMPPSFPGRSAILDGRSMIVGKAARRTLLPNMPIPINAVGAPKIVTNGAMVLIVFREGSLLITTSGLALQAGGIGDIIPVRNIESGLTVSGTIAPNGTVMVNNG
jgi:flagella basal body P-ring formation protein FlgA